MHLAKLTIIKGVNNMNILPIGFIEYDFINKIFYLTDDTIHILRLKKQRWKNLSETVKNIESKYQGVYKYEIYRSLINKHYYNGIISDNNNRRIIQVSAKLKDDYKLIVIFIDLTTYYAISKELSKEKQEYAHLLENAPFGFVLYANGKVGYFNNEIARMLGYEKAEYLKRKKISDFISNSEYDKILQILNMSVNDNIQIPYKPTIKITDRYGYIKFWELTLYKIVINGCKNIQIMIRDITDDIEKLTTQRQIAADALYINQKNQAMLQIKEELESTIRNNHLPRNKFLNVFKIIDSYINLDKDWEKMTIQFEKVHPEFFNRLSTLYPKLSVNDLKHCACIRMNFDTNETARFFNIKTTSVQMARVRLKKKLSIPEDSDLRNFILNI